MHSDPNISTGPTNDWPADFHVAVFNLESRGLVPNILNLTVIHTHKWGGITIQGCICSHLCLHMQAKL